MKNPFKAEEDVKIGMKNVPESIDFKFFDALLTQGKSTMVEVRELKKSVDKLRRITKFKLIAGAGVATFIITTFLAATTEYDEFLLNLLGGLF